MSRKIGEPRDRKVAQAQAQRFDGVSYVRATDKFRARLMVRGQSLYLGSYRTAEQAADAVMAARQAKRDGRLDEHVGRSAGQPRSSRPTAADLGATGFIGKLASFGLSRDSSPENVARWQRITKAFAGAEPTPLKDLPVEPDDAGSAFPPAFAPLPGTFNHKQTKLLETLARLRRRKLPDGSTRTGYYNDRHVPGTRFKHAGCRFDTPTGKWVAIVCNARGKKAFTVGSFDTLEEADAAQAAALAEYKASMAWPNPPATKEECIVAMARDFARRGIERVTMNDFHVALLEAFPTVIDRFVLATRCFKDELLMARGGYRWEKRPDWRDHGDDPSPWLIFERAAAEA